MTDHASRSRAEFAMPGHMARHASDDSALNASLCFGGGGSEHDDEDGNSEDQALHGVLLKSRCNNSARNVWFRIIVYMPPGARWRLSVDNIALARRRDLRSQVDSQRRA
jgi:hypothetical protein